MWPCVLNQNCFHYYYNVTDWSTCQLSKNAICGEGIKNRLLSCVRSDGKTVTMNYCEQLNLEKPAKMIAHCLVECVVRCCVPDLLSCKHKEKEGFAQLNSLSIETVQQNPATVWFLENGPHAELRVDSVEMESKYGTSRAWYIMALYQQHLNRWKVHYVEIFRLKKVCFCFLVLCLAQIFYMHYGFKQYAATTPSDCHLTEWSEWSSCELTCIDGRSFESTGRQSRSRTFIIQSFENQDSCPEQELETRPCSGGKCYNYVWKASLWQDNERTVWCQRSDGVNVTGGCSIQRQPTTTRHCSPACKKPFSYCTQSGVCGCKRGYTEIMRSDGFLDYCMKIPGLEDKKADVKTNAAKNKPINSKMHDIFKGWSIQPFNPDGKLKIWVYGVSAGGFFIIVSLIFTSYLLCKKPKQQQHSPPQQKCLTLAYDGDVDM
uniref:Uncharacterized protein n=1 Tax=Sphaerodactylus townsendi TaxID=933632 RepID=A0ACB8G164_9SAUR